MLQSHAILRLVIALVAWIPMGCQPAPPSAAPSATPAAPVSSTPLTPSPPAAPSAAPTTLPPEPSASPAPPLPEQARTCPALLPAARPPDLVIGVARHIVPIGTEITNHRAELTATQSDCRTNLAPGTAPTYTCLVVTPAELDDLWSEFRKRSFTAIRSHPTPGLSPHYGSRSLWLRWGGRHACEVSDSSQGQIDPAHDSDFSDLINAVETVGRKHL